MVHLQAEAMCKSPEIAAQHGLRLSRDSNTPSVGTPETMSPAGTPRGYKQQQRAGANATYADHASLLQRSFNSGVLEHQSSVSSGFDSDSSAVPSPVPEQRRPAAAAAAAAQAMLDHSHSGATPPGAAASSAAPFAYAPGAGGQGFNIGSGSGGNSKNTSIHVPPAGASGASGASGALANAEQETTSAPITGQKYSKKRAAVKKQSARAKSAQGGSGAASPDDSQQFMVEGICRSFLSLFLLGVRNTP